ncbi:MAG: hypothetical protein HRU07_01630 [Nitrosopumilus sp.]|jgi:hypothetical protein|nr:hypothetical protein [Nitrosopumilus sp.]NRA04875.1 hypothetical protein [Nitrosopumilus sp.]
MAKIKVRSGRGTRIIEVDDNAQKWQGEEFKKAQAARKKALENKYIITGRGTGKIKFGDIKSTVTPSTKGMWVSSGRGTGKRQLKK